MARGLWYVLGGLGLLVGGVALAAKKPKPGPPPDWTGCGTPPAYCQPPPRFKCGDRVLVDLDGFSKGQSYVIAARTWGPIPDDPQGRGLWVYAFTSGPQSVSEEANLSPVAVR
jgi:hypothetical protein